MNSIAGISIAPDGRVAAIIPTPIAATPVQPLGENENMMSLIAIALLAGQTAPAPAATPAPTPAASAVAAPAAAGKFTLDTPIETIEADAKAKEVLTADLGMDVAQHPAYDSFKSMSLNQVAPMSGGKITDDVLKKIATDLAAIK
jgi:parvulin-like peptidyl-prolyl isomerase